MSYYDILGVKKESTSDEIKKAFRKLSLKFHPDKPTGNEEKFKQINEAYETLRDPEKKSMYDMKNGIGGKRVPGMNVPQGFPFMHNPDDFMRMFFGNVQHGMPRGNPNIPRAGINIRHMMRPATINKKIDITIEEAFSGVNYPLEVERDIYEQDGSIRKEKEKIYVDIPKGIDTNELIIVREKGHCSKMKQYGDIKIFRK